MSASTSAEPSVHASPATSPSSAAAPCIHDIVCDFVAAQAEAEAHAFGEWASYRDVFLSDEVQELIRSRLAGAAASPVEPPADSTAASSSSGGPRSPKKRKIDDASAAPTAAADAEVSWTVCCLDGTTFSVALQKDDRVAEAKCAIATLREVSQFAMELFVEGEEEQLDDERVLSAAVPLFMLPKEVSDRQALEALFKSCSGAGWTNKTGWMTDAELGDWHGVKVDAG